jgi:hypothetical protein
MLGAADRDEVESKTPDTNAKPIAYFIVPPTWLHPAPSERGLAAMVPSKRELVRRQRRSALLSRPPFFPGPTRLSSRPRHLHRLLRCMSSFLTSHFKRPRSAWPASRNHAALILGVSFCVLKSTCTRPEAVAVAGVPLEVVHRAPLEVALDRHAVRPRSHCRSRLFQR